MHDFISNPRKIEEESFRIIYDSMKNTDLSPLRLSIMQRVIHTTTDFIYEDILLFKEQVENIILEAFEKGCTIITDTQMIKAGISKKLTEQLGINIECLVGSDEAYRNSKEQGITRSMAAVDLALKMPGDKVFAVGNAPTALFRLIDEKNKNELDTVEAVIGVPVGFVGACESKDALWDEDIPSIITKGRKGGSTIAVAIINAVLREAVKKVGKQ
ncbi:precorrin-8X methylmutase [Vallitalea sp.]|jgi:precorrin-8X/cobalt-precorrin-8 methylmutase|uniref:precorrin-8X methylmutase n=1 Tax=Vallitalea sp. TaxID=1882829 RepID=UPI0025D80FD4|nr:precorrin-8X methylmutase [Vallitalea sp.]MCT4687770.1 precorrin-8X methylmutase [Vallitalea sp.]